MIEITPEIIANDRLAEYGVGSRHIDDWDLPEVQSSSSEFHQARFVTLGERDAPNVLTIVSPYSTKIDSPHYMIRLKAMQVALGEDHSLVAVESYKSNNLNRKQRNQISHGDFEPLSERVLTVMESLRLKSHQSVKLYGQSMGADVNTEVAYQNQFNVSKGLINIAGLCINEAARTADRKPHEMLGAFNASGAGLLQNVLESNSPALQEAWKLPVGTLNVEDYRRKFDIRVGLGVSKYAASDLLGNLALLRGFATDKTVDQITAINSEHIRVKNIKVNRKLSNVYPIIAIKSEASTVFDQDGFDKLQLESTRNGSELITTEVPGDHSNDDNIRSAASTVLKFVMY